MIVKKIKLDVCNQPPQVQVTLIDDRGFAWEYDSNNGDGVSVIIKKHRAIVRIIMADTICIHAFVIHGYVGTTFDNPQYMSKDSMLEVTIPFGDTCHH